MFAKIGHNNTSSLSSFNSYFSEDTSFLEVCLNGGFGPAITYFDSTYDVPFNSQLNTETYWLAVVVKGIDWGIGPNCLNYDTSYYTFQRPMTSIKDVNDNNKIIIYPNPVKDFLTISSKDDDEIQEVCVYSLLGVKVKHFRSVSNQIDVSTLKPGSFFIKFKTSKGFFY